MQVEQLRRVVDAPGRDAYSAVVDGVHVYAPEGHRLHETIAAAAKASNIKAEIVRHPTAAEAAMDSLRAERNARLAASDWTQVADAPMSPEQRAAWAKYRQALRDLPMVVAGCAAEVVWPETP